MGASRDSRAVVLAGLSLIVLVGGCCTSVLLAGDVQVLGVAASVGGYVFIGRRALSGCRADDRVFVNLSRDFAPWGIGSQATDAAPRVSSGIQSAPKEESRRYLEAERG